MSSLYYQGFLQVPVFYAVVVIPWLARVRRAGHWNITFLGFISTEPPLHCPLSPSPSPSQEPALHLPVWSQGWCHQVKLRQDWISRCPGPGPGNLRDRPARRPGPDHQVHGRPCQWVRGQGLLPGGARLPCPASSQYIYCFLSELIQI